MLVMPIDGLIFFQNLIYLILNWMCWQFVCGENSALTINKYIIDKIVVYEFGIGFIIS